MAFHGHLQHEMSMPHLGADDAAAAAAAAAGGGGGGTPPVWMRYGDGNFLHLQTTSDSSASPSASAAAAGVQWSMGPADDAVAAMGGVVGVEAEAEAARSKAEILAHPLYEQLLSAHVACLRIATPVDQLPRIDAQLAQSQGVVAKYSGIAAAGAGDDGRELDQFMPWLCLQLALCSRDFTCASPGEGTGATMSDGEDDQADSEANMYDPSLDGPDSMGFGLPTESERSLMERVRQELKHELKQGYKEKLIDIREEILRKRRAGKLPGDTTSTLKAWWQSHSKWPYPTI
ncbi:hypothetical protein PR202_ga31082 [Eleusine coracana subsp. coracana]|uniref:ELK domain-containing protein n=1 Tax=Eleusine coracana subsp. coracana TaxID=191504 RepID=A0AAV5DR15_ELECO|nr:hypothetical protein PR202_ga31082 [Eleusine coracana subsp. coracana]